LGDLDGWSRTIGRERFLFLTGETFSWPCFDDRGGVPRFGRPSDGTMEIAARQCPADPEPQKGRFRAPDFASDIGDLLRNLPDHEAIGP
jgi:hypothetical protein